MGNWFDADKLSENQLHAAIRRDGRDQISINQLPTMNGPQWGAAGRRFRADGTALGPEFPVNDSLSPFSGHFNPDIAVLPAGGYVVAWTGTTSAEGPRGIMVRRFDSDGNAGNEMQIGEAYATGPASVSVDTGPDGTAAVVWSSEFAGSTARNIFVQRLSADGSPDGAAFQVNSDPVIDLIFTYGDPAVAIDQNGLSFAWSARDPQSGLTAVFGRRFDHSGVPKGDTFRVDSHTTLGHAYPSVVSESSGAFLVLWQATQHDSWGTAVVGRRFDNQGRPAGREFVVNTTGDGNQLAPGMAVGADGDIVVVWYEGDRGDPKLIFTQSYVLSPDSTRRGGGIYNQGTLTVTRSTIADNRSFESGGGIYSSDTAVSTVTDSTISGNTAERNETVFGPAGAETLVSSSIPHHQTNWSPDAAVAYDAAGNHVVVWGSDLQDGSSWGVYGQRYGANGISIGAEFRVNTTTGNEQAGPAVAMALDGRFVVTWTAEDENSNGVFARRFDSNGNPQGSQFQVNTTTAGRQRGPTVSTDPNDGFLVAWESQDGQDGDLSGVYFRRYNAGGSPTTGPKGRRGFPVRSRLDPRSSLADMLPRRQVTLRLRSPPTAITSLPTKALMKPSTP